MFEVNPYKKEVQRETGKKGVETDFVKEVRKAGGKAYKFTSENNRGVSDRLVIFPGQVWFVEIKRDNTELSPLQKEFKLKIIGFNLNHFVVYGKKDIKTFLEIVDGKSKEKQTK
jgi:hypothetical protein